MRRAPGGLRIFSMERERKRLSLRWEAVARLYPPEENSG